MKTSTLLVMILVLQAALVMGKIAFAAADDVVNPSPPGKFGCCDNCKDEFSGLISCGDVHTKCHPACEKCQEMKTNAGGPDKKYKCADLYFGSCGHPCKHGN